MTNMEAARVAREAIRAYQQVIGDQISAPWDEAEAWDRESMLAGVAAARAGATPAELHERWRQWRQSRGWRLGPVKDPAAGTHPNLRPYDQLPAVQRHKDVLFAAVVGALST